VDVIPAVFDFDFEKLGSFDVLNSKYPAMQSILDYKQVMPVCSVGWHNRAVGSQPDCSTDFRYFMHRLVSYNFAGPQKVTKT
jgi:hypothetical protein